MTTKPAQQIHKTDAKEHKITEHKVAPAKKHTNTQMETRISQWE